MGKHLYDNGEEEDYNHVYPRPVKVRDEMLATAAACQHTLTIRLVQFRLGLFTVLAVAELFDSTFPHVLRLAIVPRPWDGLLRRAAAWLPRALCNLVKTCLPGPFLPPCVALKKLQKNTECHVELLENEQAMYRLLQPIQGTALPYFYGEATC